MSQMLLPQGSASAISEQAAARSAKKRDSARNETAPSRYQDVSREHSKKLAQQDRAKQTPANDPLKSPKADVERPSANDRQSAVKKSASAKDGDADTGQRAQSAANGAVRAQPASSRNTATTDNAEHGKRAEGNAELADSAPVALTFMELQALLMPAVATPGMAGGPGASPAATGAALPGAAVPGQPLNGLMGFGALKPGAEGTAAGLSSSQTAGLTLTDTVRNGETLRPVEGGSLAADARMQSATDGLLQQPGSAAARAQADPAMALRGYTTSVDVPFGQADWGDKVMGKLSWLTARNMSVAEIHLSPADLGPMEVKVRMHNDQASVTVHAANPMVRDQLEQHSHRLRDMLSEQGVELQRFDVSDQPRQQSGEQDGNNNGRDDSNNASGQQGLVSGVGEQEFVNGAGQLDLSWRGEVDIFA